METLTEDAQRLVKEALQSQLKSREGSKYAALMAELKDCEDPTRLVVLLSAIAQWASIIADHHERFKELLAMLFSFDWDIADESVMTAFESVLISLVSANQGFLDEAFRLLIRNFTREDEEPSQSAEQSAEEQVWKETRLRHLHSTIQNILRICPLGCGTLLNVIIDLYPKQGQDSRVQCEFAKEALKVGEHVPVLQDRLVRMAIKSLLEMDLELSSALEEVRTSGTPFKMDEVEMASEGEASNSKRLRVTGDDLEIAEKVDSMLCILFDFFDEYSSKKRSSQLLFRAALDSFEKDVLRTGKAKFTQYFIFYLCNARTAYVDAFLALLLDRVMDERENLGVRENAAKFIGSFLARAKYVQPKQVKASLEKLNHWLQVQASMLFPKQKSQRSGGHAAKKRQLFVSVFQSLIYVFLFRGAQLGGQEFLDSLEGWKQLCESHPFHPLSRISEDIREEYFAVLGSAEPPLGDTVDTGGDELQTEETGVDGTSTINPSAAGKIEITVEFPFDPLELERASKKLEGVYQEWYSSVDDANLDGDEDDDEDAADEDEDDQDEDTVELDYDVLNAKLPKPIKIERIRRMLGGSWASNPVSGSMFPSPGLRPSPSPPAMRAGSASSAGVQHGTTLLPPGATAALFIPRAGHLPARQRSLSAMSTDSQLAGSCK